MRPSLLLAAASLIAFAACEPSPVGAPEATPAPVEQPAAPVVEQPVAALSPADALASVLDAQPDAVKARYAARHPAETLAFFGVEPEMTVVEALPGGGWYTKILVPYLGPNGTLVGAHYPDDIWPRFAYGDEWVAQRVAGTANWLSTAQGWGLTGADLQSTIITDMSNLEDESVDVVLFIRALHNISRFNDTEAAYMSQAISEAYRVLKPGGIVGVVQHRAPKDAPAESVKGERGYLSTAEVLNSFKRAGFRPDGSSQINANPKDRPSTDEIVWRLPPSLNGTEEGTPERAAVEAIGESDRMTLKLKKPS